MAEASKTSLVLLSEASQSSDPDGITEALGSFETPLEWVSSRPGRGGDTYYYIRHQKVTEVLNMISGFRWDMAVLREYVNAETGDVSSLVELQIQLKGSSSEKPIKKVGWGGGRMILRDGDPMKKAAADAHNSAVSLGVTKAATRLGIGLDLNTPARTSVVHRFNTLGDSIFGEHWPEARRRIISLVANGRKIGNVPITEVWQLRDVEVRFVCAVLDKTDVARSLPTVLQLRELIMGTVKGLLAPKK